MRLKRTKRLITGVNKWIENKAQGTLEFVTGVGKTRAAIIAIMKGHKKDPTRIVHVVVPTKYLKKQWEVELKKFKIKNTTVFVINTYIKEPRTCTLLIIDEIHNAGSPQRIQIFKFNYKYLLGLTATVQRKDNMHNVILGHAPIVDTVDITEAHADGYVSDFIVYNLGIDLTEDDKAYYDFINKQFYKHFAVFGRDFHLAMSCMSNKDVRERYAIQAGMKPNDIGYNAVQFNKYMRIRKNFLYTLPIKLEITKQIIQKFQKKTITFSESTDFADKITESVSNSVSYHSKIKDKQRLINLKLFNDKRTSINTLNTSKALDEGFDSEDIEMAIVTSSRAIERVDLQRTGRVIRFKEGKIALFINLYVKNTKDEEWLRMRQMKSTNIYWIDDIDQISTERPKIKVGISNRKRKD